MRCHDCGSTRAAAGWLARLIPPDDRADILAGLGPFPSPFAWRYEAAEALRPTLPVREPPSLGMLAALDASIRDGTIMPHEALVLASDALFKDHRIASANHPARVIRACPDCFGRGGAFVGAWDDWDTVRFARFVVCASCEGSGRIAHDARGQAALEDFDRRHGTGFALLPPFDAGPE